MEEFHRFREYIMKPENIAEIDETSFPTPFYKRWVKAMKNPNSLGKMDLGSLIRNILRFESEKQNGADVLLKVPRDGIWLEVDEWNAFGVEIISEYPDAYLIQAKRWSPNWLPGSCQTPPDQPLFAMEKRSNYVSASADPFLTEIGKESYRTFSQRDAIRSILTAPPGATLAVNLPTGTGKSLCAHLPGVLHGKNFGLTVVVVPTIALSIDQERAIHSFIPHPSAYYGGSERKEINKSIRDRIIDGTQQIIFTSPESLLQSLHVPLQIAADKGFLKMFVIDEAHMVGLWGDEFRPAFQQLAGFRNYLLSISPEPFMTLLLSATISELCLDTLETLFSKPGPFQVFSAVQLRPEPSYWMRKCQDEHEKMTFLLNAVAHLPRPLIIYTTKVDDAYLIASILQEIGYTRCKAFTGDTTSHDRNEIIQQWQSRDIDIVVATSAFGLGVDQAEVRAVIHACLPENIDRFYQEIGRGGRDGCASMSLLLYTDADIRTAEGMNHSILIGVNRGIQRWRQMFTHKKAVEGETGVFYVPLTVAPGYSEKDIDMNSRENEKWNIRTLNLMARAGFIKLLWEQREQDLEALGSDFQKVKIIDEKHLDDARWNQVLEPIRRKSYQAEARSLSLMKDFLKGDRCVSEIFSSIYQITRREEPLRKEVHVSRACGGCPDCRNKGLSPFSQPVPSKLVKWNVHHENDDFLSGFFGNHNTRLVLFYPAKLPEFTSMPKREQHHWRMLIRWFLEQDIQHMVGNQDFFALLRNDPLFLEDKIVFFSDIEQIPSRLDWPNVRRLVYQPSQTGLPRSLQRRIVSEGDGALEIYFLPENLPDPNNPNRLWRDVLSTRHYTIDEFKQEVGLI